MAATSVPARPRPVVFGDPKLHTDGDLAALAFAPDGSLWSVEEGGVVRCWDGSGRQLRCFALSDLEMVWCFSADARLLASASDDLSVWETASGQIRAAIPQRGWVTALAFRSDHSLVATGHDDGAVRCWEIRGGGLVAEFRGHDRAVSALAFRGDGARLASAGEDKMIHLWDVARERRVGTLAGHTDRIPALAWHPLGRRLVSAGWDNTARVWDGDTCRPEALLDGHAAQVTALAFDAGGDLLACADASGAVHVWDFDRASSVHVLRASAQEARCLALGGPAGRLASGGSGRVIHLWEPRTGRAILAPDGSGTASPAIAVSPDGSRLVCTGGSGVRSWETVRGQELGHLAPAEIPTAARSAVQAVAYSPDGRWVAGGGEDALIRVWDTAAGQAPRMLEGSEGPVTCLAFSPDSRHLASAGCTGQAIWVWSLEKWGPVLLIPDALDGCTVEALAFHPGGRLLAAGGIDWLATGGSDGAICLWDLRERCEVATFSGGVTCLAMHPSGRWLAAASLDRVVCVWDLEARTLAQELAGPEDAVAGLAYSPDGRWLACGGDDRMIRLWRVEGGLAPAGGPVEIPLDTQVKSLCFAPDGRSLFTGNGNTTCYKLDVHQLLGRAAG
jgi:WD40 repeat protein